jgi:hypothetical protein
MRLVVNPCEINREDTKFGAPFGAPNFSMSIRNRA